MSGDSCPRADYMSDKALRRLAPEGNQKATGGLRSGILAPIRCIQTQMFGPCPPKPMNTRFGVRYHKASEEIHGAQSQTQGILEWSSKPTS